MTILYLRGKASTAFVSKPSFSVYCYTVTSFCWTEQNELELWSQRRYTSSVVTYFAPISFASLRITFIHSHCVASVLRLVTMSSSNQHRYLTHRSTYQAPTLLLPAGFGICPSGTLTTTIDRSDSAWIELHYEIPSGTQKSYHPHPGVQHGSVRRVAYLPNTPEGVHLVLPRFQYAFLHGHSFLVGYSCTFKKDHQVTWSPHFPHKTNRTSGGPFGYPDPLYLKTANDALDRLLVPRDAHSCQQWMKQQQQQHSLGVHVMLPIPAPIPAPASAQLLPTPAPSLHPYVVQATLPSPLPPPYVPARLPSPSLPPPYVPVPPAMAALTVGDKRRRSSTSAASYNSHQQQPMAAVMVLDSNVFDVQNGKVVRYNAPTIWNHDDDNVTQYFESLVGGDESSPRGGLPPHVRSASAPSDEMAQTVAAFAASAPAVIMSTSLGAPSLLAPAFAYLVQQTTNAVLDSLVGQQQQQQQPSSPPSKPPCKPPPCKPQPSLQPAAIVTAHDLMLQQKHYPGGGAAAPSFHDKRASFAEDEKKDDRDGGVVQAEPCPICLDEMFPNGRSSDAVRLKGCGHVFHRCCIVRSLQQGHSHCPSCRKPIGTAPWGKGPSGVMTVTVDRQRRCCAQGKHKDDDAHTTTGTIRIDYNIPDGIQASYMENPGKHYTRTRRVAYLPHNDDGRRLLVRLQYAFEHGLTFRVGTSLTTGLHNQVTWTSVHHKTSVDGGIRAHGFPDPNYFDNCNDALDALHVPSAVECVMLLKEASSSSR